MSGAALSSGLDRAVKRRNRRGTRCATCSDRCRFVRRYQSVIWDNAEVLTDLKRLAQEGR